MMSGKMELLSPAGSFEALRAAVYNGADSVYLGGGSFNARQYAKNFEKEELEAAANLCRRNGVNLYLTLNTLVSDREENQFFKAAAYANRIGITGVIVQDLGMAKTIRAAFPDLLVHGSTQMSIHNLAGVEEAARMGLSRVVLARELPLEDIAYICKRSPIEIEVFIHGALCVCYSGQCYFSGQIGERSGNRGRCAQVCRLPYGINQKKNKVFPMSLKDLCGAKYVKALEDMGVKSLKIEGRMKRPEYVAVVTEIYKKLIRTGHPPTRRDLERLELIFSRQGFTDGYLTKKLGRHMFGVRQEEENGKEYHKLLADARKTLDPSNAPKRIRVDLSCMLHKGKPAYLKAVDEDENSAWAKGDVVEAAKTRPITLMDIQTQLEKTGGTPYFVRSVTADLEEGISIPLSAINKLRRKALDEISNKRMEPPVRSYMPFAPLPGILPSKKKVDFSVSVKNESQINDRLLELKPQRIYMPLWNIEKNLACINRIQRAGVKLCATMPRVVYDSEKKQVEKMLDTVLEEGVQSALCGNIGQIQLLLDLGFSVHGDFGLNVFNSRSILALKEMGLSSFTASFELAAAQIRHLKKYLPTEIIVYGRLPLMLTANCLLGEKPLCDKQCDGNSMLIDRKGEAFLTMAEYHCRNEIYNAHPLYLCDKIFSFHQLGINTMRLIFTNENDRQVSKIFEEHLTGDMIKPDKFTRGLYYKGVE
jgi:putative protease